MKFEIYRSYRPHEARPDKPTGDWRWRLKASNGRIVAEGGEGYKNATNMVRTLRLHIVIGNPYTSQHLNEALHRAGLDPAGHKLKTPRAPRR